ncbi:uncharacterized protein LOC128227972 [Mya arenaria]|uniref:uncharacterized protein LOC128227972 n=1 Tax=Mya arenaria TaxID=6604 RepID=UPI0022E623E5|nr:uncharacterized protein LOC128227972 [Mya arenaria]
MKMFRNIVIYFTVTLITGICGQCTFPSPFASSMWHDSTRGDLTFTDTTLTGWDVTLSPTQTIDTWTCLDYADSSKLVIKATSRFTLVGSSQVYVYACLVLTEVTAGVSYTYQQRNVQEGNAAQNRLRFNSAGTLASASDVCDDTATIPTLDFHVLVLSGSESSAAVILPTSFLFSADYILQASDGTLTCNDTVDVMDMCSDTSALTFDYTTGNCQEQVAYSAGGSLYCVATVSLTSYDCAVFYNRDPTISGTATRFTCICSDGNTASVAPNNCTIYQDATSVPTDADMTTPVGYLINFGAKTR